MRAAIFVIAAMIACAGGAEKKTSSKPGTESEGKSSTKSGTKIPPKDVPKSVPKSEPKDPAASESKIVPKRDPKASTKGEEKKVAPVHDDEGEVSPRESAAANASLWPHELADFDHHPAKVQRLLRVALDLTRRDLTYRFGSSDPKQGGMDCSGTIYHTLGQVGLEPPRDATGMYLWAKESGTLKEVNPASLDDASLRALRPGDLLFWEGTYSVRRSPPISHVMIYLGKEKASGAPVMVGASDGRTYHGKRRNGVSVFDFKLPRAGSNAKFVAYARVPGL